MLQPIMSFVKAADEIDGVTNVIGWERIDILVFNYDGEGCAITLNDGELDFMDSHSLVYVMKDDGRGRKFYKRIDQVAPPIPPRVVKGI